MSAFHPIASKLGTLRDIRVGPILLQNDFGHRSKVAFSRSTRTENFESKIRPFGFDIARF